MNLRRHLFALPFLWLAACGRPETLPPEIGAARVVLPPPGGAMAAGYFELRNPGRGALELVGVSSSAFNSVEMHETVEVDGLSRMRAIQRVTVPEGETIRFEPGGKHLMLMGATLGDTTPAQVRLSLEVRGENGAVLKVEAPFAVEQAGGAPAPEHDHSHHDHGHH